MTPDVDVTSKHVIKVVLKELRKGRVKRETNMSREELPLTRE
jgi:hypothetical protein